jgi:hypothetical protein
MSAVQRDYIERMIEQAAQAIAQVVQLIRAGQFDPALTIVRRTSELVLGPLQPVLERLDAASAVELLGAFESDRIRMYAALLSEEGTIHEIRGEAARITRSAASASSSRTITTRDPRVLSDVRRHQPGAGPRARGRSRRSQARERKEGADRLIGRRWPTDCAQVTLSGAV